MSDLRVAEVSHSPFGLIENAKLGARIGDATVRMPLSAFKDMTD